MKEVKADDMNRELFVTILRCTRECMERRNKELRGTGLADMVEPTEFLEPFINN